MGCKMLAYIDALEKNARSKLGDDFGSSKVAEWISWSRQMISELDPANTNDFPRVETEEDFEDWWLESEYDHGEFKPQRKRSG